MSFTKISNLFTIYAIKSCQANPKRNFEKKRIIHSKIKAYLMKIIQWVNGIRQSFSVCYMCVSAGQNQSTKIFRLRLQMCINLRFVPSLLLLSMECLLYYYQIPMAQMLVGFLYIHPCWYLCLSVCVFLIFNLLIWYLSSSY